MPFYKRGVISKTGRETFFFISKIIHLHYNHSYFKGLLLVQFFSLFPGFFRTVPKKDPMVGKIVTERKVMWTWQLETKQGSRYSRGLRRPRDYQGKLKILYSSHEARLRLA